MCWLLDAFSVDAYNRSENGAAVKGSWVNTNKNGDSRDSLTSQAATPGDGKFLRMF